MTTLTTFHQHGHIKRALVALLALLAVGVTMAGDATDARRGAMPYVAADSPVSAGRYLVVIAGCNDCHTDGYLESEGQVPEVDWLTGSSIGWRGPWGTTYPSNLRLLVNTMGEAEWLAMLSHRNARPPMPWTSVNHMNQRDAAAIYQYIRSLGPKGPASPLAQEPDVEPVTPYILLVPQHLERLGSVADDSPRQ